MARFGTVVILRLPHFDILFLTTNLLTMYLTLTDEHIKEIAEQLDIGFCCFWHKTTGEILSIPVEIRSMGNDDEFFEEEMEKIENNPDDYIEIEPPSSRYGFEIMANFAEQLNDNMTLQSQLIGALNNKKPFSEFKFIIDNSGEYRQ